MAKENSFGHAMQTFPCLQTVKRIEFLSKAMNIENGPKYLAIQCNKIYKM